MAGQNWKSTHDRLSVFSVIIVFLFSYSRCQNIISEFYLDDNAIRNSVCGDVLILNDSLYLRTQIGAGFFGGLNNYEPNQNCGTTVIADNGYGNTELQNALISLYNITLDPHDVMKCYLKHTHCYQILLQFPFFNLQEKQGDSCLDHLQLQGNITKGQVQDNSQIEEFLNTTIVCTDPGPIVSVSNTLKIRFTSDSSVEGAGFSLLLTAFRKPPCNETLEFLCDSNRCIAKMLTCDGTSHCLDKTDETKEHASCSTLNEVVGNVSGLGKYVVIGIVVIASGLICTVVIVIMMSQFMDRDSKSSCRRGAEDEETNQPEMHATKTIISELAPYKSTKTKKSVTIAGESMKEGQEKGLKSKRPGIRKIVPSKVQDDEW